MPIYTFHFNHLDEKNYETKSHVFHNTNISHLSIGMKIYYQNSPERNAQFILEVKEIELEVSDIDKERCHYWIKCEVLKCVKDGQMISVDPKLKEMMNS